MKVDYLIIGQGIAGSILSYELLNNQKNIFLIDNNYPNSSSRVAAGLFNPVTGRRMVHTWMAKELFSLLHTYYPELEKKLKSDFFYPTPLHYIFSSVKESNDLSTKFSDPLFTDWVQQTDNFTSQVAAPLGLLELKQAGWCHVSRMLLAFQEYFRAHHCYAEENFDYSLLNQTPQGWAYKNIEAKAVIFCEGNGGMKNPWFAYLPFKPAKGEIITFRSESLTLKSIVKQHYWIIPIGNHLFKAGATFDFTEIDEKPTEEALHELTHWLRKTILVPFEAINHQAAIRPAVLDRRPLMGEHPRYKNLFIFNGFGSKGVSLVPFMANQFSLFLTGNSPLIRETDIHRFLYK